jgi:post-segregation antitoxin (ccd killing protein)
MTIRKTTKAERLKTTVVLPRDLWKRARIKAVEEETDLSTLIAKAIEAYLTSKPRKEQR